MIVTLKVTFSKCNYTKVIPRIPLYSMGFGVYLRSADSTFNKIKNMKELIQIQQKLNVPKNRKNTFGNYYYRSCEDIVEAVKPLCAELDCAITLSDDVIEVGGRVYVRASAQLSKGDSKVTVYGWAREAGIKKAMDDAQITGSASSYARKYALNGLFAIDDTKDADETSTHEVIKNNDFKI